MRRTLRTLLLLSTCIWTAQAADLQGVIADWNCVPAMVREGRAKTLRQRRDCSLMKNFNRPGYGLITDDKKFYRLDENGNKQARLLLKNTPDKDNLKVVVTGDIEGDTVKVTNMSLL